MLSMETLERIYHCKREIDAGNKLLEDLEAERNKYEPWQYEKRLEPKLKDGFGRERNLQLGVPSGENCHRLFMVSPLLAESIIKAHIANKKAELVEAEEQAKIELGIKTTIGVEVV